MSMSLYPIAQGAHVGINDQRRMAIFTNTASGEKILQQWLEEHPDVVKRFEEMKKTTRRGSNPEETCDSIPKSCSAMSKNDNF